MFVIPDFWTEHVTAIIGQIPPVELGGSKWLQVE